MTVFTSAITTNTTYLGRFAAVVAVFLALPDTCTIVVANRNRYRNKEDLVVKLDKVADFLTSNTLSINQYKTMIPLRGRRVLVSLIIKIIIYIIPV